MFRTLVDGHLTPDKIATRLNHALVEDNDQSMFVTMFIGLIDLKSGHMSFCNAGHNPPLLDGEFMEMEANAPIGLWPELQFQSEEVGDMHGKTLFVYTDGINEAENIHKEQFGKRGAKVIFYLLYIICLLQCQDRKNLNQLPQNFADFGSICKIHIFQKHP